MRATCSVEPDVNNLDSGLNGGEPSQATEPALLCVLARSGPSTADPELPDGSYIMIPLTAVDS